MKLIALSGGIASGKSTIAARLTELGAVHIDADQLAREIMEPGSQVMSQIRDRLGTEMISPDGTLNRAALANKVFADDESLALLNSITHPAVRALAAERVAAAEAVDADAIVIYDVPLLVEAKVSMPWDLIVIAEAPSETRIQRMMEFRGMSRLEAERRIAQQAGDAERRKVADIIIDTDGTLELTRSQTDALWERLQSA